MNKKKAIAEIKAILNKDVVGCDAVFAPGLLNKDPGIVQKAFSRLQNGPLAGMTITPQDADDLKSEFSSACASIGDGFAACNEEKRINICKQFLNNKVFPFINDLIVSEPSPSPDTGGGGGSTSQPNGGGSAPPVSSPEPDLALSNDEKLGFGVAIGVAILLIAAAWLYA